MKTAKVKEVAITLAGMTIKNVKKELSDLLQGDSLSARSVRVIVK